MPVGLKSSLGRETAIPCHGNLLAWNARVVSFMLLVSRRPLARASIWTP